MRPLHWHQTANLASACAWVLGATAAIGSLRLLPWLFVPEVPWSVVEPFARAIGAKATETSLLLGLPLGCALGAAALVRQERAPGRTGLAVVPGLFALAFFLAGATWKADASQPGRVAIGLLEQTRQSCDHEGPRPRGAVVPMVGLSWLCFRHAPPRIVGALPGSGGEAWFSAAELEAATGLHSFEMRDFRLTARSEPIFSQVRLRVAEARVTGLPIWGRPTELSPLLRAGLLALTALGVGLLALECVRRWGTCERPAALAMGGVPAVVTLAVLESLDQSGAEPAAHLLLPLAGAGGAIATASALVLIRRAVRRARFAGQSPQ